MEAGQCWTTFFKASSVILSSSCEQNLSHNHHLRRIDSLTLWVFSWFHVHNTVISTAGCHTHLPRPPSFASSPPAHINCRQSWSKLSSHTAIKLSVLIVSPNHAGQDMRMIRVCTFSSGFRIYKKGNCALFFFFLQKFSTSFLHTSALVHTSTL